MNHFVDMYVQDKRTLNVRDTYDSLKTLGYDEMLLHGAKLHECTRSNYPS